MYLFNYIQLFLKTALLSLLILSCNSKKKEASSFVHSDDLMYSETLSEKVFSKSWNLMVKGQQLADNGSSLEEIIKIFPDSTLIHTNEREILFFMKGSVPMLIEVNSQIVSNSKALGNVPIAPQIINSASFLPNINFSNNSFSDKNKEVDVVGSQRGEENRQSKTVVLISPYLSEFGTVDDYYVINDFLKKNRNYNGNITVRQKNLKLADFEDLDKFDIVHISSHSKMFCGNIEIINNNKNTPVTIEDYSCRTILYPNIEHGFNNAEEAFNFIDKNNYRDLLGVSSKMFVLRNTFFDYFYNGKLNNKIWYFSTCEMGELSDMTSTMKRIHNNGHFLYWTDSVNVEDAQKASKEFYKNLVEMGLDADKAFVLIPNKLKKNLPSDTIRLRKKDLMKYQTDLKIINTGVLKHGIEVVEMIHPETYKTLKTGDLYPVTGDFGDGHKESISLKVKLLGYTKPEFEAQQMRLSLKVDDETVLNKIQFLSNQQGNSVIVRDISGTEYGIELELKNIEIEDLEDKTEITLKTYLHFDDTYFSIHSEKVKVRAQGILAIMNDGKELVKFYYDDDTKAVRVETSDSNENYMDSEGYFYFFNESDGMPLGWVKSKAMASMFMGNFSFSPVPGKKHINDNDRKFNFPVIAWAQKHTLSDFGQNQNFKQQVINCGDDKICTKFSGVAGQEKGHYAIFNPNGKLIEMGKSKFNIKFTYGEYEVKLPKAEEISFNYPSF